MTEQLVDYLRTIKPGESVSLIDGKTMVEGILAVVDESMVKINVKRNSPVWREGLRVWSTSLAELAGENFKLPNE